MKIVHRLFATAILSAVAATASAGPIAITEFNFNNNLVDSGTKPLTMSQSGSVTYSSAVPAAAEGKAITFNGGSYARATTAIKATGDFSISFWMKSGTNSNTGSAWYQGNGLVDAERAGGTTDWGISLLNNKIAFGMGGWDTTLLSTNTVTDNKWHLVSTTWAMSSGEMKLYLDGVLDKTAQTWAGQPRGGQNVLTLGAIAIPNNFYNGSLAHVQVFDSVLSSADIAAIAAPSAVPEPASIALMGLGMAGLLARRRRKA